MTPPERNTMIAVYVIVTGLVYWILYLLVTCKGCWS
jgi:hypothetical protein